MTPAGAGAETVLDEAGSAGSGHQDPGAALEAAVEAHLQAWSESLQEELSQPLLDVLAHARDAHRRLVEEAGLQPLPEEGPDEDEATPGDGPAPESPASEVGKEYEDEDKDGDPVPAREAPLTPREWRSLRDYREGVHQEVLLPILGVLQERDPARVLSERWNAFLVGLQAVADRAPTSIRRPAPRDQYAPAEDDGPGRALAKAVLRTGRGAAAIFSREPREQVVEVRALARSILVGEELPGVVNLLDVLYRTHADPLARLEMALTAWIRDWFPMESGGHNAHAHLAPADRERLEALRGELREASVQAETPDDPAGTEASGGGPGTPTEEGEPAVETEPHTEGTPEDPRTVAAALQRTLDEVADSSLHEPVLVPIRQGIDVLKQRLATALRYGGTPLAPSASGADPDRHEGVRKRMDARNAVWERWFTVATSRFSLGDEILSLQWDLEGGLTGLYSETLRDSLFFLSDRIEATKEGLRDLQGRAEALSSSHDPDDAEGLASSTESLAADARAVLEGELLQPLLDEAMPTKVENAGTTAAQKLSDRLMELPTSVTVHPLRPLPDQIDPNQTTRTILLRDVVHQAVDLLRLEAIRTSTAPLVQYLTQVEGEVREVAEMVAFNLTSARDALLEATTTEAEPEEDESSTPATSDDGPDPESLEMEAEGVGAEAAHALSLEGLERAADGLDVILAPGLAAWSRFAEDAHGVLQEARDELHGRLAVEGTVQEQIRDVRSLVRAWFRGNADQVRQQYRSTWPRVRRFWKRLYVKGLRLVRRGRSAVGGADARRPELARDVLGGVAGLLAPLPLIYRRLYSFKPLNDPSLLVGRDEDAAWVGNRYARWKEGPMPPAILTGPVTVGHTSFLNVLSTTVFQDARVVRINLAERYETEEGLARRLAVAFWEAPGDPDSTGTPTSGQAGPSDPPKPPSEGEETPPWDFSRVEERLGKEEAPGVVVLLERFEHTLLRVPGGMDLAERFLGFQSRTAQRVLWLNSVSDPTWKLLASTRPRAAALVHRRELALPDRETLEEILLVRHRRSGVPLEFVDPENPSPLLRRKLQRAREDKERQAALRADFFDRLYRESKGNVPMAILLWLKSADFTSRPGWLRLVPTQGIRFAFVDELDLPLSFALMAFLEHESLTVDEYARVFSLPQDEAFQSLEALRQKFLIDRLEMDGGLPVLPKRVEPGVRYRVPPLITQVIAEHLRNQNILH